MFLSDRDIAARLDDGSLVIDPITDFEQQIQPASVDIRLGNDFLEFQHVNIPCIDPNETDEREFLTETHIPDGEVFILHPGDFVLGTTHERVEIPPDLLAHVQGRSSFGRLGIVIHATAGIIDPGYRGEITLELSNLGNAPVALHPKTRIGQLLISSLSSPAERPYGTERGSKYQDQKGPQASKLGGDPEHSTTD